MHGRDRSIIVIYDAHPARYRGACGPVFRTVELVGWAYPRRALGDTIAIYPPLIIQPHEIDAILDRVARALDHTAAELSRSA